MSFIRWCWTAFVVVWLITAVRAKRTRTAESFLGQLSYRLVTVIGAILIFDNRLYTGILLAIFGTALATDVWRSAVGFVIIVAGFWLKARREESVLSREFGVTFADHVRATGMFVPRVF